MYHLFNRIYLAVDSIKSEKHAFYLASKVMAENYDERELAGPILMGLTADEDEFVATGFTKLLTQYKGVGDKKIVIYTSLESYGKLISKWLKAIFPNATLSQVQTLLGLELVALNTQGVALPKGEVVKEMVSDYANLEGDADLRTVVRDIPEKLSLEYKLLDYLSGNKRVSIAEDVRMFALRSTINHVHEIQRNLVSLFFSAHMQKKYGYDASQHVGEVNLLRKVPGFNFLTDPNLTLRITRMKQPTQDALCRDFALYLDQEPQIEKLQIEAERAKLRIISSVDPIEDGEATDLFISMIRASNEHTDYLDWADMDKLKVHVIHWAVGLKSEACKGFEL
jgi:hypothetical protein